MTFYKQATGQSDIGIDVAAAGSTISDATVLTTDTTTVTVGSANQGVQLPDNVVGKPHVIRNTDGANNLKIYPHSATGTLNGGSAGVALDCAAGETATCIRLDDNDWIMSIAVAP